MLSSKGIIAYLGNVCAQVGGLSTVNGADEDAAGNEGRAEAAGLCNDEGEGRHHEVAGDEVEGDGSRLGSDALEVVEGHRDAHAEHEHGEGHGEVVRGHEAVDGGLLECQAGAKDVPEREEVDEHGARLLQLAGGLLCGSCVHNGGRGGRQAAGLPAWQLRLGGSAVKAGLEPEAACRGGCVRGGSRLSPAEAGRRSCCPHRDSGTRAGLHHQARSCATNGRGHPARNTVGSRGACYTSCQACLHVVSCLRGKIETLGREEEPYKW